MLNELLHQERLPRFAALWILTTAGVWAVYFYQPGNGFLEGAGYRIITILVFLIGLVLNIVWGDLERFRSEYGGVWIANVGVSLSLAAGLVWGVLGALLG